MGQQKWYENNKEELMPKRGENVRKRKDGRWEGRYSVKDVYCGTTCVRSVYAKSYTEVRQKLAEARRSAQEVLRKSNADKRTVSIADTAEEWIAFIQKNKKHSTYIKYKNIYQKYIEPLLGDIKADGLTQDMVNQILDSENDISLSIQKSVICVTNLLLKYVSQKYKISVFKLESDTVRTVLKPVEALSMSEQQSLIECLCREPDVYKTGIMLCLATGVRLGEICALKWEDIDLKNRLLYVNRTVQRIEVNDGKTKTALVVGEPKSIFSKRTIPLADTVIKWLLPYYKESGYLLKNNAPMEPRTYQNKYAGYLNSAGMKKSNFHILRHTFATNCINSGMDIKSLSEIMGHSDVKITLNRYVHPTMDTKREYINTMTLVYNGYMGQKSGQ